MTLQQKTSEFKPDQSADQPLSQALMYSRTDERGVIQGCNTAFIEQCGYSYSDLHEAAHRILRHPDMPRGVFKVFWDSIHEGHAVGAYIKNKDKSDIPYWTFTTAIPFEQSVLAFHTMVRPEDIAEVETLYTDLLAFETKERATPESSADHLSLLLKQKGYSDYHDFCHRALSDENSKRDALLERRTPQACLALQRIENHMKNTVDISRDLVDGFRAIGAEPTNMRILSNRLEGSGNAISCISQNYELMSREIWQNLDAILDGKEGHIRALEEAAAAETFAMSAQQFMDELMQECEERASLSCEDSNAEMAMLKSMKSQLVSARERHSSTLRGSAERILEIGNILRRQINGLDMVRLLCRVESGRLDNGENGLSSIIERLDAFHIEINDKLVLMTAEAAAISRESDTLTE